jgi:hypothetical protein
MHIYHAFGLTPLQLNDELNLTLRKSCLEEIKKYTPSILLNYSPLWSSNFVCSDQVFRKKKENMLAATS